MREQKTTSRPASLRRVTSAKTGGALLTVVILTTVVAFIVGVSLRMGSTEQRLNERHFVMLDARNAAEAITEYGAAQLSRRWSSQSSFTTDELAPNRRPLELSEAFHEVFPENRYDLELVGGAVELGRYFIDPDDPSHADDPHRGKMVQVRNVNLYGQAQVNPGRPFTSPTTARVVQTLQLRDAPLFSHGVFYNMDLEFHPGPIMTMNGPVHANGDVWVQAIDSLTFTSGITATGEFRYGYMLHDGGSNQITQTGNVWINNGRGGLTRPYKGSGDRRNVSSYWTSESGERAITDAGFSTWAELAMNRWGGNVQDGSHEVPPLNPLGFRNYVRNNPNTTVLDDALNHGYAILEPNQPLRQPDGTLNPAHKRTAETEKFSFKSGMIIRIHHSLDGLTTSRGAALPDNAVPLRERSDAHDPWSPYTTGLGPESEFLVSFHKIDRSNPVQPMSALRNTMEVQALGEDGEPLYDSGGNPVMETIGEVQEIPVYVQPPRPSDPEADPEGWDQLWKDFYFNSVFAAHPYREQNANAAPHSGMFDRRRNAGVDLIEVNVGAFRQIIEDPDGWWFWRNQGPDHTHDFIPSRDFNGVLYVEFPTDPRTQPGSPEYEPRPDNIVVSNRQSPTSGTNRPVEMGLILTNASQIPNPNYNQVVGRDEGFTLATNNTLYVRGHFNADGDPATGSNTAGDHPGQFDPPAALIADAIMPLSSGYDFTRSKENRPGASGFTEFNAGIVQGLRPTDKGGDGSISGGNHNFKRFLEHWGGIEFRYRGSMVALYESEIATQGTDTAFYSPPVRNWGFYEGFQAGRFPPGTPNLRSFRLMNTRFLSAAEYSEALADLGY